MGEKRELRARCSFPFSHHKMHITVYISNIREICMPVYLYFISWFGFCSCTLFDKDGRQVSQQLVIEVGDTLTRILKEVCFLFLSWTSVEVELLITIDFMITFFTIADWKSKGWTYPGHVYSASHLYCFGKASRVKVQLQPGTYALLHFH